jgi:hypothetical protein
MISLESLVPLLSRSEKAMIVIANDHRFFATAEQRHQRLQRYHSCFITQGQMPGPIRNLSENIQLQLRQQHFAGDNSLYERVSPATVTGCQPVTVAGETRS